MFWLAGALMRPIQRYVLTFSMVMLCALSAYSSAASTQVIVNASVYVNCVFGITLTPSESIFVQPSNMVVNYSVKTLTPCNIPSLTGNFVIIDSLSRQVYYTTPITINGISQVPVTGSFSVNSLLSDISTDDATMLLISKNFSNSTTAQFQVISGADIFINSVYVTPSTVTQGSQITLMTNASNLGNLASSNMILNILISGPGGFSYTGNYPIKSLSPVQSEVVSTSIGGVSPNVGTYVLQENISYQTSFTENSVTTTSNLISNNVTTVYTVPSSGGGGGGSKITNGQPPVVTNIGVLQFEEMPLFSSVLIGNSTLAAIGFHNSGISPIWVNITLPNLPYGKLGISANSIFMLPNQTGLAQMLFTSGSIENDSSYIIPINFSVTQVGQRPTFGQFYTGLRLRSNQVLAPVYLRSTSLTNYSKNVETTLTVYNPTSNIIYNTQVSTIVPFSEVTGSDKITQSGAVHNITTQDSEYVLKWRIAELQAHATTIVSYTIVDVSDPQYFYDPVTSLTTISPTNVTNIRVFDINIPTFYVNTPENITISSIYTGINQSNITFTLAPPLGVVVNNQVQRSKVFPNTALKTQFNIGPITTSGTSIFQLTITGPFPNLTYSLPVVVLQNRSVVVPSPSNTVVAQVSTIQAYERGAIAFVVLAVIVVGLIVSYVIYRKINTPKYDESRAERMQRIRQRIKRQDEEP
jgi:hypothetical protein